MDDGKEGQKVILPQCRVMAAKREDNHLRWLRAIARQGWHTAFGCSVGVYAKRLALDAHNRKYLETESYCQWVKKVGESRLSEHYAHSVLTDPFVVAHARSQFYELITTIRTRLDRVGRGRSALDAGASDGLFLDQLGLKNGVGLNIVEACTRKIRSDGMRACRGDLEWLPFQDKAFDTVICCQALEHLPNPIHALRELTRVCRGRIFLSIPWVPLTRIKSRPQDDFEGHIFEFSTSDFPKIVSHTSLTIGYAQEIEVMPQVQNPFHHLLLKRYLWRSYFPKLQYYELVPGP